MMDPIGMKKTGDIVLSGVWDDATRSWEFPARIVFHDRPVRIIFKCHRILWIDWYREQYEFEAFVRSRLGQVDGLSEVTATMTPTGVIKIVPAEWWRRAGYRVITLMKGRDGLV